MKSCVHARRVLCKLTSQAQDASFSKTSLFDHNFPFFLAPLIFTDHGEPFEDIPKAPMYAKSITIVVKSWRATINDRLGPLAHQTKAMANREIKVFSMIRPLVARFFQSSYSVL